MEQNISIEEVILNLSKKIVSKRKSRILFLKIFVVFSIIGIIFIPGLRNDLVVKGPEAISNLALISTIVTIAGLSLLFMIIPATFQFNAKSNELIAVFDKALENYLTEIRITKYCRKARLEKLQKRVKTDEVLDEIAQVKNDIARINAHFETIDQKYDSIKKNVAELALAS